MAESLGAPGYIAAICQILLEDSTLYALVDGQVIPGLNSDAADDYLSGSKHCCIGVSVADEVSTNLPGVAYHEVSANDMQAKIDVINGPAASDTYAWSVAHRVWKLLKVAPYREMDSVMYQILANGMRWRPYWDQNVEKRVHVNGLLRIKYYG